MDIEYQVNPSITARQFLDVLNESSLGERRPVDDFDCIQGMIEHSNLVVSAWDQDRLVGIARSVTDFHYACYLSDLAVVRSHQRLGIGKQLQRITQNQLGPKCSLILLAAPAASDYYNQIGFSHNPRCWVLERDARINE
ncbi:MAG: GNAT family N-acetyltransferase [Pseudomonadota bacterium]